MCRDFDDMAYMFLIVINSKKFWRYRYNCVWDYHISLESTNPNTLNTRLNKSSLRETLHYYYLFEQLYYLLAISALSITITYTLLLSIARTSKQEYYSYITNYLVALDWLFPYLKWSKLYLLIYLPFCYLRSVFLDIETIWMHIRAHQLISFLSTIYLRES